MLDFADEIFHQMPFSIQPGVVFTRFFGSWVRWNDRFAPLLNDKINKALGSIAPICNQALKVVAIDQGLGDGMALSSGQTKAQRVAQAIDSSMKLGAKATATAPQGLFPAFFVCLRHRDGHAQSCCQSARFPCRHHRQSGLTSVPIHPAHTSAQSVCRWCSTSHTRQAASAIALHYGLSTSPLRQNDGNRPHFQHKHSGLGSNSPEFSSISHQVWSHHS